MQTLPNRTRIVLVALLVVLSAVLVVPAASGATTDTYAQQQADDEPNDDVENATTADTSRAINGEIGSEGDVDYYAISLRKGSQVEIGQGIGSSEITLTLLDESGDVVATRPSQSVYEGEEDLLIANASDTGTYYLKVEGNPGDEYSIGTTITEPDANEANDDTASATDIESGERVVGTLVRGDRDVFAIDADAGEEITVIGNATAPAADVTIYGPDESALASDVLPYPGDEFESEQGYGTPVVTATAEEDGTYYVAVAIDENNVGNVNGPYNLTVTTSSDAESPSAAENATTTDESTDTDGGDATTTAADTADSDTTRTADNESDAASATDDGTDGEDEQATADSGEPTTTATQTATTDETATDESAENDSTTTAGDATTETAGTTATADSGTATADAPSTSTATATGNDGDVSENVEETAVNGPGFGIAAALVALLGAALLATRRN